jgi:hypothetical protein
MILNATLFLEGHKSDSKLLNQYTKSSISKIVEMRKIKP